MAGDRDMLVGELRQLKIEVVPDDLPPDYQGSEALVNDSLARCTFSVHLLGRYYGRKVAGDPMPQKRSLPHIQFDLATQAAKPRIVWLAGEIDENALPPDQKSLVDAVKHEEGSKTALEWVRGNLQDLKDLIRSRLPPPAPPASGGVSGQPDGIVFITAHEQDINRPEVREILGYCAGQGFDAFASALDDDQGPREKRDEAFIRQADGLLILYGYSKRDWVTDRAFRAVQSATRRRRRPLVPAVLDVPPPPDEKPALLFQGQTVLILDARNRFSPEVLGPFLERIRAGGPDDRTRLAGSGRRQSVSRAAFVRRERGGLVLRPRGPDPGLAHAVAAGAVRGRGGGIGLREVVAGAGRRGAAVGAGVSGENCGVVRVAVMRPGNNPIAELADALLNAGIQDAGEAGSEFAAQAAQVSLGRAAGESSRCSSGPACPRHPAPDPGRPVRGAVPLRLGRRGRGRGLVAEARAFVSLLLEAAEQEESPICVMLTMRSEFLADCTAFTGLPEAINEGLYLVPRLTRDQSREASGTDRQAGAEIENRLVNELLDSLGDDPDQLPILQHALMRLWSTWEAQGRQGPLTLAQLPGHRHAQAIAGEPPPGDLRGGGREHRWSR